MNIFRETANNLIPGAPPSISDALHMATMLGGDTDHLIQLIKEDQSNGLAVTFYLLLLVAAKIEESK